MKFNLIFLLLVSLILVGCNRPPQLAKMEYSNEAKLDYRYFKKLNKKIATDYLILLEGLPHPMWESELLKKEKERDDIIEIGGFGFYTDFWDMEDSNTILKVILDPDNFEVYGGPKLCGGYHPDYNFIVKKGSDILHLQICFGCHELKIIEGEHEHLVDMSHGTRDLIKELLQRYFKNRPESEIYSANKAVGGIPTSSAGSLPPL